MRNTETLDQVPSIARGSSEYAMKGLVNESGIVHSSTVHPPFIIRPFM
jgi:hypothetical protein